jgi:CrcB protein
MIMHVIATGLGGALGAILRLGMTQLIKPQLFKLPLAILVVNVIGCFLMGLCTQLFLRHMGLADNWRYFLITGVLGGFTTFSAFSLDAALLLQRHDYFICFVYIVLSVMLSIAGFFLGFKI